MERDLSILFCVMMGMGELLPKHSSLICHPWALNMLADYDITILPNFQLYNFMSLYDTKVDQIRVIFT